MKKLMGVLGLMATLVATSAAAGDQEYLSWTGVRDAWKITKGAGVKIALLNTGVNYHLPEFRGRIEKAADGSYGYDAVTNTNDPMDFLEYGLGTQVASLAAGNKFGVAPEALIVPVRVFDDNGLSSSLILARGVNYAINRGVNIIELGGGPLMFDGPSVFCEALQRAEKSGILLVLPAGNSSQELKVYPSGCDLANGVVVAGTDSAGELSFYSNYGFPAVHLAALAENIWRVSRDGSVQKGGKGTSFSAAFAAGVAALVWSAHSEYSAAQVKTALIRGVVPKSSLRGKVLANGFLHALLATQADTSALLQ